MVSREDAPGGVALLRVGVCRSFNWVFRPQSNLTFKWNFNNTLETVVELPLFTGNNVASVGDLGGPDNQQPFTQSLHGAKSQHQQHSTTSSTSYGHNSIEKQSGKTNSGGGGGHRYHHPQGGPERGVGQHRQLKNLQQREENLNAGHLYSYKIDTFSNFGTVTCYAENSYGSSGPCYYHILAAGTYQHRRGGGSRIRLNSGH